MNEQTLKILNKYTDYSDEAERHLIWDGCFESIARDVDKSHIDRLMKFTEWVLYPDRDITVARRNGKFIFRDKDDVEYSMELIYDYWKKNVESAHNETNE